MSKEEKIILGVDPGTSFLGYGVIKSAGKSMSLISLGTIDLSKYETHQTKLQKIFERLSSVVKQYQPSCCSIEAPFYGKNVQSMLKLGRAQGVAITVAMLHELPVIEYSPKKIKLAVTGNGNASKEQVAAMLQQLLKFDKLPRYKDATDGLAAAVCHHFQNGKNKSSKTTYSSWNDFVKLNPAKVASGSL